MKLAVILAAAIFLGAGIVLLLNGNWESAIFCLFIGLALGVFFFRG